MKNESFNETLSSVSKQLTDAVIKAIESGKQLPWQKPWNGGKPFYNMATGHVFTGMNPLICFLLGGGCDAFATFNQIKKAGGKLLKGSKGFPLLRPKLVPKKVEGKKVFDEKGKPEMVCLGWVVYTVFAERSIEGGKWPKRQEAVIQKEFDSIDSLEKIVANLPELNLVHEGKQAFYSPLQDKVTMPPKEAFNSQVGYYQTLIHEIAHWSATRVNQKFDESDLGISGKTQLYSFEELRSEITACQVLTVNGVEPMIENSTAYLQGWLKELKSNPEWILLAVKDSNVRTKFICEPKP